MRTLSLVLACLACHGHAYYRCKGHDECRAFASLLLSNPLLPSRPASRSTGPLMQYAVPTGTEQMTGGVVATRRQGSAGPTVRGVGSDVVLVQGNSLKTWAYQVS